MTDIGKKPKLSHPSTKTVQSVTTVEAKGKARAEARAWFGGVTAVKLYVVIAAILIGVLVGLFLLVPIFKDNCVIFTTRCNTIQYQSGPNGQLLVIDNRTGFTYWYDGVAFVFSYGDNLPGKCPTQLTYGVTGDKVPINPTIPAGKFCTRYGVEDTDGKVCCVWGDSMEQECKTYAPETDKGCCSFSASVYTPNVYAGEKVAQGQYIYSPSFGLTAWDMKLVDGNILCARDFQTMSKELVDQPIRKVHYRVPTGDTALDIYQAFQVLERKGIFKRPAPPQNSVVRTQ